VDIHLILDNYATHKEPESWNGSEDISLSPAFTPTSSSWMNLVERFFADLSQDVVREGSFCSVQELVETSSYILLSGISLRSRTGGGPARGDPSQDPEGAPRFDTRRQ